VRWEIASEYPGDSARRLHNDEATELQLAAEEPRTYAHPSEKMGSRDEPNFHHVLDTPGATRSSVPVRLERQIFRQMGQVGPRKPIGRAVRSTIIRGELLRAGPYRLTFDTAIYFTACGVQGLYPVVEVTFQVRTESSHFIFTPVERNGYTTYGELR